MGDIWHDDVAVFHLRSASQDGIRVGVLLPHVFARSGALGSFVRHAVQADGDVLIQRDGFQLMDGFELVVELPAQLLGLVGGEFQGCQVHKVVKDLNRDLFTHRGSLDSR